MPVLIISMILFLYSNCYANTGCEHEYGEIKYTWSPDKLKCTAERSCTRCNEVESETADAMISIIQERNCIYPEVAIFQVSFDNAAFGFQTKRVQTAEAMGHTYGEIEYTWSTDNLKCTAKGKCRRCNEVNSETADAEASIVQERNCTLPELTTYSVTFENSAFGTQTKERVQTAEAAGHTWKYEVDAKSSNQINAHCTQTKYQEECEYQKSTATLTLNAEDSIYTGKEYDKVSMTNNISSITGATCGEIYYEGTNYKKSTTPPTNPGTYTASVTIGGATATKTFTISKLDSTYTAPTAKTLTYNGTEQELVNSGQTEHGKLWYCLKDSGTWQEGTIPKAKDAKKYTVLYYLEGDANHKDVGSQSEPAGSVEVTIQKVSKEPPKVTAVPETVKGQGNGQITGVDSSMEYRKDGDKDYTAITGENVTGLQAGTYFVCYKESKNYNASKEAEVIIASGTQLTITLPSKQEGYILTVDKNVLDWHEEATLTFTLKEGYTKTEDFAVLVNGKKVELNDKNRYVIRDIETNMEVSVTGVKLNGNTIEKLKRPLLLAKGKGRNKRITLSWLRYSGASGYEVYWSYCNGKKNYKKFATVKNNKLKVTHKKLKNNRDYKYYIVAYRMENGKKIYLAKSNVLHVAMKQSEFTNAKSITLNKKKVTLKVNKTFKIRAKVKLESKKKKQVLHGKTYRYYTDNSNVATVSKKGVITAKAKGNCSIYVLTNNGVYKKVKVTVK